jgi:predicted dehydrogenase
MSAVRIAVAGAGLIGRRHLQLVSENRDAKLAAIVDPSPGATDLARDYGVELYASLEGLFEADRPDAVILATPNSLHVAGGLACLEAGVPVLVEKPLAESVEEAMRLVEAAERHAVPLLVGHHRRHSPLLVAVRRLIDAGALGKLVAVTGTAMFYKPDDYFDAAPWRRQAGGGPVLINMVHEVDNLRALCGEIVSVQAMASNQTRGFEVEDTVAMTLKFSNGALGSFLLSDATASARSWEQTSQENKSYPTYDDEDCYVIAGTQGSLGVPTMRLKTYSGKQSWWEPFDTSTVDVEREDPLELQLEHFIAVIRGQAQPLVNGYDAVQSLRITRAIAEATTTGHTVPIQASSPNNDSSRHASSFVRGRTGKSRRFSTPC